MREKAKLRWPGGWWRSLIAILIGNGIYYGAWSYLPEPARHQPYQLDWGLAVDFWICVAVYGLSLMLWPKRIR